MIRNAAALGILLAAFGARGQGPTDIWSVPDAALAWWAFEPPAASGQGGPAAGELAADLVEWLGAWALPGSRVPILSAALAQSVRAGDAHRVSLLDVGLRPLPDGGFRLDRLALVLEARASAAQDAYILATEAGMGEERAPEHLGLPEGFEGRAVRAHEPWRDVEYGWGQGLFLVGLGRGSVEAWLRARVETDGAWLAHRRVVERTTGGEAVFEMFIGIGALRRAAPEAFAHGAPGRLLGAWFLANARDVMLHARAGDAEEGPSPVMLDVSWSARSEPPVTIRAGSLGQGRLPEWARGQREGWGVVLAQSAPLWIRLVLDTRGAAGTRFEAMDLGVRRRDWSRAHGERLDSLLASLGPIVVAGPPREGDKGAMRLVLPLAPGVVPSAAADAMAELAATLHERVRRDGADWSVDMTSPPMRIQWRGGAAGDRPAVVVMVGPRAR